MGACLYPVQTWLPPNGGRPVFSRSPPGGGHTSLILPCNQCSECRLERSRQWAMRCTHEAQLHDSNCFITLTYSDDHLPGDHSLSKRTWQLFMKSFRKAIAPTKVRFFMCGEYGENFSRPHYHACIFGYDFPDKVFLKNSQSGDRLYTSALLDSLWRKGFAWTGSVTFESAGYVARYCTKKVTGVNAADHYVLTDADTGESFSVLPEFALMSRRPGIGKHWHERYKSDLDKDYLIMRGKRMRPPKFYDRQLPEEELLALKESRKLAAKDAQPKLLAHVPVHRDDLKSTRLGVRRYLSNSKLIKLKRGFENDF